MPGDPAITEEIKMALETINASWLSGNPAAVTSALSASFHSNMVIKDGELNTVAEGHDASVASYVDFIKMANISKFEQAEPDIRVFGDSAIASYNWRIVYTLEGTECDEKGGDVFAFFRTDGKWLAVWRAMLTCG
jgi:ketosteroid isomerase-like protein